MIVLMLNVDLQDKNFILFKFVWLTRHKKVCLQDEKIIL